MIPLDRYTIIFTHLVVRNHNPGIPDINIGKRECGSDALVEFGFGDGEGEVGGHDKIIPSIALRETRCHSAPARTHFFGTIMTNPLSP